MTQSRAKSLIESVTNVTIGFVVSLVFWSVFIVPVYDLKVSFVQNIEITLWFTLLAIVRSYVVRRYFNRGTK